MPSVVEMLGASAGTSGPSLAGLSELAYSIVGPSPIEKRIQKLFWAVTLGRHDPEAVARIKSVSAACDRRNDPCVVAAGVRDLRTHLVYKLDDGELDRYPPYMTALSLVHVDCSGMTAAMMTHAAVMGTPSSACTIKQRDPKTGVVTWNHVYNVMWPRIGSRGVRRRVPVDISEAKTPVGWEPQSWRVMGRRDWRYCTRIWDTWFDDGADPDRLPSC